MAPDIDKCPLGQTHPRLRTAVPHLSAITSDIANYSPIAVLPSLLWAVIKCCIGPILLDFFHFKPYIHPSSDGIGTLFLLWENNPTVLVPCLLCIKSSV